MPPVYGWSTTHKVAAKWVDGTEPIQGIAKRPLSRIKYEITAAHDQIVAAAGPGTQPPAS
ncbi:hypothetical protein [Embleya sp. NPDC005575]|uniref:hypothetical protein n=1 Tax=Embleya sp. NPDC005575 TaxID=3156892 RepID=UPI0033B1BC5C